MNSLISGLRNYILTHANALSANSRTDDYFIYSLQLPQELKVNSGIEIWSQWCILQIDFCRMTIFFDIENTKKNVRGIKAFRYPHSQSQYCRCKHTHFNYSEMEKYIKKKEERSNILYIRLRSMCIRACGKHRWMKNIKVTRRKP